jgi:hypothetical protein
MILRRKTKQSRSRDSTSRATLSLPPKPGTARKITFGQVLSSNPLMPLLSSSQSRPVMATRTGLSTASMPQLRLQDCHSDDMQVKFEVRHLDGPKRSCSAQDLISQQETSTGQTCFQLQERLPVLIRLPPGLSRPSSMRTT